MAWTSGAKASVALSATAIGATVYGVTTEHSATVFSGNQVEWVSHSSTPAKDRRDSKWEVSCQCIGSLDQWVWKGIGPQGTALATVFPLPSAKCA